MRDLSKFSYSRVESFISCPAKWKYHYVDGLKVFPSDDPKNALYLGVSMHTAIEKGADAGVAEYYSKYAIASNHHVVEEIKMRIYAERVWDHVPRGGIHELALADEDGYVGFVDYLTPNADGTYDMWDWKYANPKSADRYTSGAQLQVYKYYLERAGYRIAGMHFVLFPKINIRMKKTEDERTFRQRVVEVTTASEIQVLDVAADPERLARFMEAKDYMLANVSNPAYVYETRPTRLCDWCDFQLLCEKGLDTMLLPENVRRKPSAITTKKLWLYGAPFTGKTTLADAFPKPLMINTDGNIKAVTAPYVRVKDDVKSEGRITKRVLAWDGFKEIIEELERGDNTFETVVVDLLEDLYEACRLYMYNKKGWEHESDDSFRAWDMVRTEFYSTMKRLLNLDRYNIILISHEDTTKDLTKRTGEKISSVRPNMSDKVASKIAGMVDVVARVVVVDGKHLLSFKTDEVQFGGGRIKLDATSMPLTYDSIEHIYQIQPAEAKAPAAAVSRTKE